MSTPISRRAFVRTAATAAAATALPVQAASARDFSFVVINDLHYRDARCGDWFQRVIAQLRASRPRPAFVVLAGDLSDEGTSEQLGAIRDLFQQLPIPVKTLIGNHDCRPDGDRTAYEQLYGKRLNYRFDHAGYQFLVLDSTQGRSVYRTKISASTLTWLDEQLPTVSRDCPVIVLTHFPLGRNWLRPLNAHAVLDRLHPYPFRAALSGHWHGLTEHTENSASLSTGRCCSWWRTNHDGSPLKGYTLCHAAAGTLTHEFVPVPTA